jgi:hypothetical protein
MYMRHIVVIVGVRLSIEFEKRKGVSVDGDSTR